MVVFDKFFDYDVCGNERERFFLFAETNLYYVCVRGCEEPLFIRTQQYFFEMNSYFLDVIRNSKFSWSRIIVSLKEDSGLVEVEDRYDYGLDFAKEFVDSRNRNRYVQNWMVDSYNNFCGIYDASLSDVFARDFFMSFI